MAVALLVKTLLNPRNKELPRKYEASVGSRAISPAVAPRKAAVGIQSRPWASCTGKDQMRR